MPTHPLAAAEFTVYWASKRLHELRTRINAILESKEDRVVPAIYGDEHADKIVIGLTQLRPPPLDVSACTGEVVYHLRSGLDQLVYALSHSDSGEPHPTAQFPITSSPEAFKASREVSLSGVSDLHVALFEPLQPYRGCDWTRSLAQLTDPDKHRYLIAVLRTQQIIIVSNAADNWTIPPDDFEAVLSAGLPEGSEVNMNFGYTANITFGDGSLILKKLEMLHSHAVETIEAFKPLFDVNHPTT